MWGLVIGRREHRLWGDATPSSDEKSGNVMAEHMATRIAGDGRRRPSSADALALTLYGCISINDSVLEELPLSGATASHASVLSDESVRPEGMGIVRSDQGGAQATSSIR